MLEIIPIAKSIMKRPAGALLIVLQLAVSIAIVSNALSFISQRHAYVSQDIGFERRGLLLYGAHSDSSKGSLEESKNNHLLYFNTLSSVKSAIAITGVPLTGDGNTEGMSSEPLQGEETSDTATFAEPSILRVTEHALVTLGARLVIGRDFTSDEYLVYDQNAEPSSSSAIVSESFANGLFPDEKNILGKIFYNGANQAFTIVGVIEDMFGHRLNTAYPKRVVIFPQLNLENGVKYLVRVDNYSSDSVRTDIAAGLRAQDENLIVDNGEFMKDVVQRAFANDHAIVKLLSTVLIALVCVNALGVVGLTSFWVAQRRKHIGIRRALGATRMAIMRYFIVENIMLVSIASVVGALAAISASTYMVKAYSFGSLPWVFIPLASLVLLIITVLAALVPVHKASHISPVEAVAGK